VVNLHVGANLLAVVNHNAIHAPQDVQAHVIQAALLVLARVAVNKALLHVLVHVAVRNRH
jgi:hypothetical protein